MQLWKKNSKTIVGPVDQNIYCEDVHIMNYLIFNVRCAFTYNCWHRFLQMIVSIADKSRVRLDQYNLFHWFQIWIVICHRYIDTFTFIHTNVKKEKVIKSICSVKQVFSLNRFKTYWNSHIRALTDNKFTQVSIFPICFVKISFSFEGNMFRKPSIKYNDSDEPPGHINSQQGFLTNAISLINMKTFISFH